MRKSGAYGHDFTAKLVQSLAGNISTSVNEILDVGRNVAISIELPLFSAWLTAEAGDVKAVINAALELKKNQTFCDIRGLLREIRIAYDEKDLAEANQLVKKWEVQLAKASANLKNDFGVDTGQGVQGSFLIKVYNSFAAFKGLPQFPEFNFKIPLPEFIQNNTSNNFSNLYKDVTNELTSIERLGGMRDLMASGFIFDDKHYHVPPKTEDPKYRKYASDWKLPM